MPFFFGGGGEIPWPKSWHGENKYKNQICNSMYIVQYNDINFMSIKSCCDL